MIGTVRIAKKEDAKAACYVLRRSILECCIEDHRNDIEVLTSWLQNKTTANLASWFASDLNFAVVAADKDKVVGVGLLTGQGEVSLCYVLPEVRFTGTGKAMLQAMEKEAIRRGIRELKLTSTYTGKAFYLRNGFEQTGAGQPCFGLLGYPCLKRVSASTALYADALPRQSTQS